MFTRLFKAAWFLSLFCQRLNCCYALSSSTFRPKGSAAHPLQKKKVAVLGTGGYLGALTFGFLQRAASLYGTGIGGVRSIGATADTAVRMNRVLSKNFCLAVADESYIKLTDLQSVEAIQQRLESWDALIFGNDLHVNYRPVTANTFEKSPNDKTYEVYWDAPRGLDNLPLDDSNPAKTTILNNIILAAQNTPSIKHLVAVDNLASSVRMQPILESCSIPYTCIQHGGAALTSTQDYTYRKGVQGSITVALDDGSSSSSSSSSSGSSQLADTFLLAREDLAAVCVQSLLSFDWSRSRSFQIYCKGEAQVLEPSGKRPDQEWCVNSNLLDEALCSIN